MTNNERFRSIYQRYYRRVVRFFVQAFHLSEEDAEDLAQDTFLRFYEALDEYRGDAEWAFLETTARNVAYNRIRSQKTAKRGAKTVDIDDPAFGYDPPAPAGPDYAEMEEAALRWKRLGDAIAELPAGQRQCVQLWLADFTYEEIAAFMGISVDAVKSRLRDAKKTLRARLGEKEALPEDES
jgi:RNA polymerase sigma-70 factor (ECF subfamily)